MAEQEEQKKQRIPNGTAVFMIIIAIIMDLLGPVGTVLGTLIFGVWFWSRKIPLISPKQLVRWGLSLIGDAATLGVAPGMTVGVILMIILTRTEDKLGVSVLDKVGTGKLGKLSPKDAERWKNKTLRRGANPERTQRAQERLARMQENRVNNITPIRERQPMQDINYRKAA